MVFTTQKYGIYKAKVCHLQVAFFSFSLQRFKGNLWMNHEKCTVVQRSMLFLCRKPVVFSVLIPSFRRLFGGSVEDVEEGILTFV